MKIIRSSKHILKFSTKSKILKLENLFKDFKEDLNFYIDLILNDELLLKKSLSSKILPINIIKPARYRQLIYKHASEIIRSQIKQAEKRRFKKYQKIYAKAKELNRFKSFCNKTYKELNLKPIIQTRFFIKPNLKNVSINFDCRFLNYSFESNEFDEFIQLKLPYIKKNTKLQMEAINLPIKYHKQSLKFSKWTRKNTIRISKINNNFYITFIYEKEINYKEEGNSLGIDIGYKKLLSCSNGQIFDKNLFDIYQKLSNKQRGSKKYKKLLKYRTNVINELCNKIPFENLKELVVENLKYVKHKSKFSKKLNNKMQYWIYRQVLTKLENLCEINGVYFTKINPAYTSQTCSNCGVIDKSNRNGEIYQCSSCGIIIDADINAAINILHRGVYSPSAKYKNNFMNIFL